MPWETVRETPGVGGGTAECLLSQVHFDILTPELFFEMIFYVSCVKCLQFNMFILLSVCSYL